MTYFTGYLAAVPTAKKAAYVEFNEKAWPVFKDYGAIGLCENWGVDVPDGKLTSFPMAVKKKADETVVFSWMEWPDKETCDAAWEKVMSDPRMEAIPEMPFDGQRMMWGGFEPLLCYRETGGGETASG